MKKSVIIAVIVALLFAGGAAVMLAKRSEKSRIGATKQAVPSQGNSVQPQSLKALMSLGQRQSCTYEYKDDISGTTKGAVYIDGNKMRADFQVSSPDGKSYDGSMINDGTYMYTWSSATDQGFKMELTAATQGEINAAKENPSQYLDTEKQMDYQCRPWNTEEDRFTPPQDITFMDYSEQMKQVEKMMPTGAGGNAAACASCDGMSGEQKVMCLQTLRCN